MRRPAVAFVVVVFGVVLLAPPSASAADDPVVIVAGTLSPSFANEPLAARMRGNGYSVSIFVLPNGGLGDIADGSAALATFVTGVLADTGATHVDLVGHSQGGLVARHYVKYGGGDAVVDSLISLGAPQYGTSIANLGAFFGFGNCLGIVACNQMAIGSALLNDLNAGDDTIGNVRYTNIFTAYDELVRPVWNASLQDGATNVRVQSHCWWRVVGHIGLILDGAVYDGVRDALRGRSVRLNCWAF